MTSPIASSSVTASSADIGQLSQADENTIVDYLMRDLGQTKEQAQNLANALSPDEAKTYIDLVSGNKSISRSEAQAKWGLSEDQLNALFGSSNAMGVRSNPIGNLFLDFLMLSYSLELDTRQLVSKLIDLQKDEAIQAAESKYDGAIGKFACSMLAGLMTFGFLGAYTRSVTKAKDGYGNQWLGPIGSQQFTQIVTASGDFIDANYQLEGSKHDAEAQKAGAIYQQLLAIFNSTSDKDDQIARNIAG